MIDAYGQTLQPAGPGGPAAVVPADHDDTNWPPIFARFNVLMRLSPLIELYFGTSYPIILGDES